LVLPLIDLYVNRDILIEYVSDAIKENVYKKSRPSWLPIGMQDSMRDIRSVFPVNKKYGENKNTESKINNSIPDEEQWNVFYEIFCETLTVSVECDDNNDLASSVTVSNKILPPPYIKGHNCNIPCVIVKVIFNPLNPFPRTRFILVINREVMGGQWKYMINATSESISPLIETIKFTANVGEVDVQSITVNSDAHADMRVYALIQAGLHDDDFTVEPREGMFNKHGSITLRIGYHPRRYVSVRKAKLIGMKKKNISFFFFFFYLILFIIHIVVCGSSTWEYQLQGEKKKYIPPIGIVKIQDK
jgi:hypothetical protein